jgi:hypothetical protein
VLALQGNVHEFETAMALAAVLVLCRRAILRAILGVVAVVVLAALVTGAVMLVHALHA